MNTVSLFKPRGLYRPVLAANSVANDALTPSAPTTVDPATTFDNASGFSSAGYIKLGNQELELLFFGTDANNETFKAIVELVAPAMPGRDSGLVWIARPIIQVSAILSNNAILTMAGNGIFATANSFLADTVASDTTYAAATATYSIEAGISDVCPGALILNTRGFTYARVRFNLTTSAASANALYRTY